MKHIDTQIAENAHKLGTRLELQNYDERAPLSWGRAIYTTAFFTPACSIHRSSVSSVPVAAGEVRRSPSPKCACLKSHKFTIQSRKGERCCRTRRK